MSECSRIGGSARISKRTVSFPFMHARELREVRPHPQHRDGGTVHPVVLQLKGSDRGQALL